MRAPNEIFQGKITAFLAWEKRKRREFILAALGCYGLAGALVLAPLLAQVPSDISIVWLPLALSVILAPLLFIKQRWIAQDTVRALAHLDKTLRTGERTLTAWDLLRRQDDSASARLVIQQAGDNLATLEQKKSFPRRWRWQAYSVLPLAGVWLALCWFQFTAPPARPQAAPTLAQKLKEFARELQEKAKGQGLKESLQAGKDIEKLAQRELEKNRGDQQLKKDLAGVTQKLAAAAKAAEHSSLSAGKSEQSLQDLKAELEAARDLINAPAERQGSSAPGAPWRDRLASLPQLSRQLANDDRGGQPMSERDAKSLLDKLDKQVSAELDRRTLLDAQEFLQQMLQQGAGESGESNARAGGQEQPDAHDGEKRPSQSNLPGSEPGKETHTPPSLPQFTAGPRAQVKTLLGAGSSTGVEFKGKPLPGKSTLSQQEIVATYRRQAEQELNSERVPETLKETVRNYFMSLGEGKQ